MNTIGEHIKEERIRKGMTQQQLAEKIFVTRQSISRYEKAERTPDLFTLQKLAEVLDTVTLRIPIFPHILPSPFTA